jgi:hypothetical protein
MPFVAYRFARLLVAPTTAVAAAVGATLLAGFDLIVVGLQSVRAVVSNWPLPGDLDGLRIAVPSSHLDSWIHHVERQFNAPLIATMWAPHHVAAVLVALVVFILLAPRSDNPHLPRSGALVPGLLVGALPALSAYVAMALAAGVAGAVLRESLAERIAPYRSTVFSRWWRVGAISAVAAIPTYRVLSAGSSSSLTFAISGSGDLANGAFFNTFFGASTWSNLLDTPAVLFFDLGLVGVLSAVWILRPPKRLSRNQLDAIAVAATILVLVVFVRPQEGIGNNLYARGMLLVWFVLAPLAAAAAGSVRRSVLVPLAIVSVLGTGYAAAGSVAESMLFRGHPREDVDAMQWVNSNLPAQTVVAFHPQEYGNTDTYWLRRSIVLGNRRLAGLFGATGAQVAEAELELTQAYSAPDQKTAARRFDALGADVMLLRSPWYRDRTDRRPVAEPAPDVALWAQAPCFRLAHQSPAWMIIQRLEGDC